MAGASVPQEQLTMATSENESVVVTKGSATMEATQTKAAVTVIDPEAGVAVVGEMQHKTACVVTEDGIFYREVREIRMAVVEIKSLQEQETAALAIEGPKSILDDKETCEEKCCEVCAARINGRKGLASVVELKSLRKAREVGKKHLKEKVFPLFSTYGRELWTYAQFLITVGLTLYSVIDLAASDPSRQTIVDFVSLGFSIVSCALTVLDIGVTIYFHRCKLACDFGRYVSNRDKRNSEGNGETDSETKDVPEDDAEETDPESAQEQTCCNEGGHCDQCCKLCCKNKYADLVRMLLIEVFVYPITICSMFKLFFNILRDDGKVDARAGFSIVVFGLVVLWKIVTIYGIRTFVLCRTILAIQKFRKDGPVEKTARSFHIRFFVHVMGQMFSQVVMIVCVGAKMYYENRNFSTDNTVHISGFLWYMIIGAFVIPLAGVLTFAIANFYSVQEYPIGFFLDLLHTVVKKRGFGDAMSPSMKKNEKGKKSVKLGMSKEMEEEAKRIAEKIESEFTKIHNTNTLNKYGYVFQSPLLIALSIAYAGFLLAFAICCILVPSSDVTGGVELVVLYSSSLGWIVFYILGVILVNLLNILVLLVAGVWVAIIVGVLLLIILVILLIIFCIVCHTATSKDTNRRY